MIQIDLPTGAPEEEVKERRGHRLAEVVQEVLIVEIVEASAGLIEEIEEHIAEKEGLIEVIVGAKEELIAETEEEVDLKAAVEVIEEVGHIKEPRDLLMRAHGNGNTKTRNAQYLSKLLYQSTLRFLSFPKIS
jgi:hypothetical protein